MTDETVFMMLIHAVDAGDPAAAAVDGLPGCANWNPDAQAAIQNTGRSGSGSAESKEQQEQIVQLLELHGTTR